MVTWRLGLEARKNGEETTKKPSKEKEVEKTSWQTASDFIELRL